MGWGHCGTDDKGREIGYCIQATCDEPGCDAEVDRGLAYVCGRMHGGDEYTCGGYFCEKHLFCGEANGEVFSCCQKCHDTLPPDPEEDF